MRRAVRRRRRRNPQRGDQRPCRRAGARPRGRRRSSRSEPATTSPRRSAFRPRPDAALEVLLEGRELRVDLGQVNGRVFVNTSGGGFIARSVGRRDAAAEDDRRPARLPDRRSAGAARIRSGRRPRSPSSRAPCSVTQDLYAFAVCNSRLIGGGRLIAPDAVIDDGLLDVCLIESMSALEFVALAQQGAPTASTSTIRACSYFQASAIDQIELAREVNVNTDGEVFERQPLRVPGPAQGRAVLRRRSAVRCRFGELTDLSW